MDRRLLNHYNRELQHLREMGGEFAKEFPKIAGRLGMDGFEVADPYVERLLEGFAFLASRIQAKLDAEFPRFTQHLLETVYPHYLAPTPSVAIVRFQPDLSEGALAEGFPIPRQTVLRSILGKGDQTPCEYRTAHDVTLWPLELVEAQYYTRDVATLDLPANLNAKAGLRLRVRCTVEGDFSKTALDNLTIYLRGQDATPMHLYEQVFAHTVATTVRPPRRPVPWQHVTKHSRGAAGPGSSCAVKKVGFENEQALLPYGARSFHGYRLLQEYFTCPQRYMFFELQNLARAVRRHDADTLDIIIVFDQPDLFLENNVELTNFELFCAPAVNLFRKRCDRIHLTRDRWEYHVIPDRTRPMDYEIHTVTEVTGFGARSEQEQQFLPFYAASDLAAGSDDTAFYAVSRMPRLLSNKERRKGPRTSSYAGSEVFVSLVDGRNAPFRSELRQLAVAGYCTNRDLPMHMPLGTGRTDFTLESGAPVESVRVISGPTRPKATWDEGEVTWRLISQLSLNYLSLIDTNPEDGATALRDLLSLYGNMTEAHIRKQVEGVKTIASRPITRRVQTDGPIAFARGLEVTVTFDEVAFEGSGVFLLGAVLDEFFAKYVSLNSFTETVVRTLDRNEIIRWPARIGRRHML